MEDKEKKAYRIREGLVLETVCGQHLLIATLKAREACPYVTQLNDASFFIWEMLFRDKGEEEITAAVCDRYGIPEEEARRAVSGYVDEIRAGNYII